MKKFIFALSLLCIGYNVQAQRDVTQELGDFNTIKVFDLIEVKLIASDEQKIIISGKNADKVRVTNDSGKLKIRMDADKRFSGEDVYAQVYFKSLDIIDGNEGARILVDGLITQDEIELKTQEGARIQGDFKVDDITIKAVTGGIIELSGEANKQDVTVNTGGVYEGRELETKNAKVFVQAGGEVEVYASQKIDIKIRAGGDVFVYGDPEEVSQNRVFGGRIKFF